MRPITRPMLIRAMGLYAILGIAAAVTLDEPRMRGLAIVVVVAMAAKTGLAYLAQER